MRIFYTDDALARTCTQQREATKAHGAKNAKKLAMRLTQLHAATRVTDLISGDPHPLKHDRQGQFAVSLDGGCRLVFRPNDDPPPLREDESIDWSAVTDICIVFIGDYHD
jgi:toxin HigB-1